ncbi:Glycerate dehydrogenase [Arachis hypogaea]|uniref:glycerate dehydrogenase n=1 Tax=Arachis hypogaea TaxID=3818 RepID=A0A6B9VGE8_ARAHY|nr:Glycerate dehydrogenase [Arachis hypogaea]
MSSPPGPIHFFQIVNETSLQNGELRIRRSFVSEHWQGISSPVLLVLPNGSEWKMDWEKRDADVCFVQGWKEFAEFYSLEKEQVLMFKYEGKSRFNVIILGRSGLEREYPLLNGTLEAEGSGNSKRPNSPLRKKRRTNTEEEARFNEYSHNARPRDRDGRRIFLKSEASNNVEAPKHAESSSALERARAFSSKNLWFYRRMRPAYINNYLLFRAEDYVTQEERKENEFLSLWVTDESRPWHAKISKHDNNGQIMLTTGWKQFVRDNNLKLNDVCVFEKTRNSEGLSFRVIIYRATQESTNIPSQDYKRRGRASKWTEDQFTIALKQSQTKRSAHIPYGFAKKYLQKAKALTLQIGNRIWEIKLDYYPRHSYARLSSGWDKFVKDCNLKEADECTFQLIDRENFVFDPVSIEVWNPNGKYRVVSTKPMPGTRWINLLIQQDCRVEICTQKKTILSVEDIIQLIGDKCDGVIGQLTEDWGEELFKALSRAGGKAFSNMAVGYNNVDVNVATKYGVAVGNTPGVLTETTAELAASLTLAAARRIVEADEFMRAGLYDGWLPHLFVGNLLKGQTVGVIGAGRIGSAYARMMVEGFKMNLIYFDLYQSTRLEKFVTAYGEFLKANGEKPVTWKRASSMDEVLQQADIISLHPVLDKTTYHLVNKERLSKMKKEAILINCSRGPVIDEAALVDHLRENPMFRVGLDVFEDEPYMKPGLSEMKNAIVVPHIASASKWTREGMATLAALNVLGKIKGYPVWFDANRVEPFLNENAPPPAASPSIVNAKALGLPVSKL